MGGRAVCLRSAWSCLGTATTSWRRDITRWRADSLTQIPSPAITPSAASVRWGIICTHQACYAQLTVCLPTPANVASYFPPFPTLREFCIVSLLLVLLPLSLSHSRPLAKHLNARPMTTKPCCQVCCASDATHFCRADDGA